RPAALGAAHPPRGGQPAVRELRLPARAWRPARLPRRGDRRPPARGARLPRPGRRARGHADHHHHRPGEPGRRLRRGSGGRARARAGAPPQADVLPAAVAHRAAADHPARRGLRLPRGPLGPGARQRRHAAPGRPHGHLPLAPLPPRAREQQRHPAPQRPQPHRARQRPADLLRHHAQGGPAAPAGPVAPDLRGM
ncbi:MAG: hypothetical protein AVDCRST_MAG13-3366, partial [uncultured Solirubrobacteraceae bacterium]